MLYVKIYNFFIAHGVQLENRMNPQVLELYFFMAKHLSQNTLLTQPRVVLATNG